MYADIVDCRVTVDQPEKHQHKGSSYNMRIDISVPGKGVIVSNDLNEDLFIAVNNAFDAARR